jgi:uncharacterized membrane protein YphA (DoxX/SURF4 family)
VFSLSQNQKIHFSLRIAAAMCFIGHGAFGIITKAIWCNYFAVFGIDKVMSYKLMPIVGSFDILMGILLILRPYRFIPLWLVIWGGVTALCRPLSGEPLAEFIERTGNFGAPLCLLLLSGGIRLKYSWLTSVIDPNEPVEPENVERARLTLRLVVFLLLAGHGWLNLMPKPGLISQYSALGFSNPVNVAFMAGLFEIMAAMAVLIRPLRSLILVFLIWKMGTELFYPHYGAMEWVERGGSYGSLLAFWFCLRKSESNSTDTLQNNVNPAWLDSAGIS